MEWYHYSTSRRILYEKKPGKYDEYDFSQVSTNWQGQLLIQIWKLYQFWRPVTLALLATKKFTIFEVFGVCFGDFFILLHQILFGNKILTSSCSRHQKCSSYLGNEAQISDFAFSNVFWNFTSCLFRQDTFLLANFFSMYINSHKVRYFSWHQVLSQQLMQCKPEFCKICPLVWFL